MKILLTGGGTMGSVSPLMAIYEEAKSQKKDWQWFWVGTKKGPERDLIQSMGIQYEWLPAVKLRRYFSWQTIFEPLILLVSFLRSLFIIAAGKPDLIIAAGSFVSVPVIWAGWFFRKKIIVHQQDIRPTLSNKLVGWCANLITLSFEKSAQDFPERKSVVIGNPVRTRLDEADAGKGRQIFNLDQNYKTLLIIGGSSGAQALNRWVWDNIDKLLTRANVIHITGYNNVNKMKEQKRYQQIEYLADELPHIMAAADLVISRAGLATLSELSYLKKASVLAPIPDSHQEDNAFYFADKHAAITVRQGQLNEALAIRVLEILTNPEQTYRMSEEIYKIMDHRGRKRIIQFIDKVVLKKPLAD